MLDGLDEQDQQQLRRCPGVQYPHEPFVAHYPFAMHSGSVSNRTPWNVSFNADGQTGFLHQHNCNARNRLFVCSNPISTATPSSSAEGGEGSGIGGGDSPATPLYGGSMADFAFLCPDCKSIPLMPEYARVVRRANKATAGTGTHDSSLTFHQLVARRADICASYARAQSKKHNELKKTKVLTKRMGLSDEIFVLLSQQQIPRLHALLGRALDQGWGLQAVLKKVGAALKGLYSAKKYDQRDADLGFLIVKLGNRKLAYALNKEVGAASKSTVHRMCDPTRFLCCAGTKTVAIIRENMDRFIFSQPHPPKRCLWVLGVDDVAVDERLRFSKALGVVLGLCREHSGGVDVSIQGLACLERISAALKAGEVHMAKEATVGALLPIRRENYQARPVFASGTCKKDGTAVSIIPLYRAVIGYWYEKENQSKIEKKSKK